MRTVGAFDAKTHFARLLDEVAEGAEFTITRRGVPVAKLVPLKSRDPDAIRKAIEELRALRRGRRLEAITFRQLIDEGRRH